MSNTITVEFDADDIARVCRSLDIAVHHHFVEANTAASTPEFTERVMEADAVRALRVALSERLVAGR